jgi:hypothetical protein
MMHSWFIHIASNWRLSPRNVNRTASEIVGAFSGTVFPLRMVQIGAGSGGVNSARSDSRPAPQENFKCHYQGVGCPEWPKDNHEHASPQFGETFSKPL